MKQPIKKNIKKLYKIKNNVKKIIQDEVKYGTSKLELKFAKEFLDNVNISYIYQYEAKDIGRFYDFAIIYEGGTLEREFKDGIECVKQYGQNYVIEAFIEVDGDYWHANPKKFTESKLNKTQKWSKKVDDFKDKWAIKHGIPVLRIWEDDIHNNKEKILNMLKDKISEYNNKQRLLDIKNKRH